jgi:hypothetical protein
MKLYDNVEINSIATDFIGKPSYAITDGWNTDYIDVDYNRKTWVRVSDYFFINELDFLKIDSLIFPDGSAM